MDGSVSAPLNGSSSQGLPYASGLSRLVRLVRLNAFERRDVFATTGVRAHVPNLLLACSEHAKQTQALARALREPSIPEHWRSRVWLPFEVRGRFPLPTRLRACVPCLEYGYHTMLFQLPWVTVCPWHRCTLTESCPSCGRPLPVAFEDLRRRMLACRCGKDFIDRKRARVANISFPGALDSVLSRYLQWAGDQRATRVLWVPETDPLLSSDQTPRLVDLPDSLARVLRPGRAPKGAHRWSVRAASRVRKVHSDLSDWSAVANIAGARVLALPLAITDRLVAAAKSVMCADGRLPLSPAAMEELFQLKQPPHGARLWLPSRNPIELWLLPPGREGRHCLLDSTSLAAGPLSLIRSVFLSFATLGPKRGILRGRGRRKLEINEATAVRLAAAFGGGLALSRAFQHLVVATYAVRVSEVIERLVPKSARKPVVHGLPCAVLERIASKGEVRVIVHWMRT